MTNRVDVETAVAKACRDDQASAVTDRLLRLMSPGAALLWLKGQDAHLGGANPIAVLMLEGSKPVLDALDAFEEGAFA